MLYLYIQYFDSFFHRVSFLFEVNVMTEKKIKRRHISEEAKKLREYVKSHEIFLYVDENGKPYGTIKERK